MYTGMYIFLNTNLPLVFSSEWFAGFLLQMFVIQLVIQLVKHAELPITEQFLSIRDAFFHSANIWQCYCKYDSKKSFSLFWRKRTINCRLIWKHA